MSSSETLGLLREADEIIKDRLYFMAPKPRSVPDDPRVHSFSVDSDPKLQYMAFYADFGPLNLGHLYRFCAMLNGLLADPNLADKKILFYSSANEHRKSNAVYLIGSYMVIFLSKTPEFVDRFFSGTFPPLVPFRDASCGPSTYNLMHVDVWRGIAKAMSFGWLDFSRFDVDEYDYYEKVENGDLNWIIPGRMLAFSGPHAVSNYDYGYRLHTPEDYVPYFKSKSVSLVIRLNKSDYEPSRFTSHGIKHLELYFIDGGVPSDSIIRRFMAETESCTGPVAVHCKAGLGRTGTLIALYMMKHFDMEPAECIGWLRVCRPGSVIGPQQQFLHEMQAQMRRAGEAFRRRHGIRSTLEEAIAQGQGISPARYGVSTSPAGSPGLGTGAGAELSARAAASSSSPLLLPPGAGAGSASASRASPSPSHAAPAASPYYSSSSGTRSSNGSRMSAESPGRASAYASMLPSPSPTAGTSARHSLALGSSPALADPSTPSSIPRGVALRSSSGKITSPGAGYDTDTMTTYATPAFTSTGGYSPHRRATASSAAPASSSSVLPAPRSQAPRSSADRLSLSMGPSPHSASRLTSTHPAVSPLTRYRSSDVPSTASLMSERRASSRLADASPSRSPAGAAARASSGSTSPSSRLPASSAASSPSAAAAARRAASPYALPLPRYR